MTRQDQSHNATEWMQAVLASDGDLYEAVIRAGIQALMEGERDTGSVRRAPLGPPCTTCADKENQNC